MTRCFGMRLRTHMYLSGNPGCPADRELGNPVRYGRLDRDKRHGEARRDVLGEAAEMAPHAWCTHACTGAGLPGATFATCIL